MLNFLKSFVYAVRGIGFGWKGRNFRVQTVVAVLVIALGFVFGISTIDWLIVLIMIGLVLSSEMMNTAIERLVDFVSPEFHPQAGRIKDLAAGSVLILSIASSVVGVLIFRPYVVEYFQNKF